jgi:tetratricopeptide (TPR) repeat protein
MPDPEHQLETFKELLQRALAKGGPDSPKVAVATEKVADLLSTLNRSEEELPLRQQHLEACRRNLGPDDLGTTEAERTLALCLVKLKQPEEADQLIEHALAVRTSQLGPEDPRTMMVLALSASVARKLGRFEQARDLHLRILKWIESQEASEPVHAARIVMQLGTLMAQWREFNQASEFFERAFGIRRDVLGPDDPDTLGSELWLAFMAYDRGLAVIATGFAEDVRERATRVRGVEAPEAEKARWLLARIEGNG